MEEKWFKTRVIKDMRTECHSEDPHISHVWGLGYKGIGMFKAGETVFIQPFKSETFKGEASDAYRVVHPGRRCSVVVYGNSVAKQHLKRVANATPEEAKACEATMEHIRWELNR